MIHRNSYASLRLTCKIWAAILLLCVVAMPFVVSAQESDYSSCFLENIGAFEQNENGEYVAKVSMQYKLDNQDGLLFYDLSFQNDLLNSSGLSIRDLMVKDAVGSVYTVQSFDSQGEKLGDQKTIMLNTQFVLPKDSVGFVVKLYGQGTDFKLLSDEFTGFTVEMTLLAEENAQIDSMQVSLSGQKYTKDGIPTNPAVLLDTQPVLMELPQLVKAEETDMVTGVSDQISETIESEQPAVEQTVLPVVTPPPFGSIAMVSSGIPQGTNIALASVDAQQSLTAGENGDFSFEELPAGEYNVFVTLPKGMIFVENESWKFTKQGDMIWTAVSVAPGQEVLLPGVAFEASASLQFTAFVDSKRKGELSSDFRGVSGVKVEVLEGENVIASGATDDTGVLNLEGISVGDYVLRITGANGYCPTVKGTGSCVEGGNGYTAVSEVFSFASGETVTASAGFELLGSFSGRVFEDLNNDGLMGEDEPGVAGVVLRLESTKNKVVYELVTDETGLYSFGGLVKGSYSFSATLPEGCLYARYSKTGGDLRSVFTGETLVRDFRVGTQEQVGNKNVGVIENGMLTGKAFMDLNYNGVFDEGEPGVKGVTLEAIRTTNDTSYGKVVTDEEGMYTINGLRSGSYRLRVILPDNGTEFTVVPQEPQENANLFGQREGRRETSVEPFNVQSGSVVTVPVGVAIGASVTGTVFTDENYDGQYAKGEKKLYGVKVYAVDEDGIICADAATSKNGKYVLEDLMPGKYVIKFQRIAGNGFTRLRPQLEGGSYVVELLDGFGQTAPIEISMGQSVENVNAGMLPSATVSGKFFKDLNDNGLWDEGEAGMTSVKVRLASKDGEIDLLRPVEADGTYFFDGVMPGEYTLTYQLPEHCEMAQVAQGGNTLEHQGKETVSEAFTIAMGQEHQRPLTGGVELGSLEGTVIADTNANGVQDEGETSLAGAAVKLIMENGEERIASSDADGSFFIRDLRPGNYQICVDMPEGYIISREAQGLAFTAENQHTVDCPWSLLVGREKLTLGGVRPASIAGAIWLDENKDGVRGETEALLSGLTLELVDENTGMTVESILTADTGFLFDNVRPGTYSVSFIVPQQAESANDPSSGFVVEENQMKQANIVVAQAENRTDLTAGLVSRTSIGGTLTLMVGSEESLVTGVEISLWEENGSSALAVTQTDENGYYQFDGLWPGQYQIRSALPQGMIFVRPGDTNYAQAASIITNYDASSGTSDLFKLEMAKHQLNCDILFIKPAKIGDQVWLDENGNGLIDGGEPMIPGVKVFLISDGKVVSETVSDEFGYYLFDQVYPGTYTVQAQAYPELTVATPVKGMEIISSALVSGDGNLAYTNEMTLESGMENKDVNLGYILLPGQSIPSAIVNPPHRDWTDSQAQYIIIVNQDWEPQYHPYK